MCGNEYQPITGRCATDSSRSPVASTFIISFEIRDFSSSAIIVAAVHRIALLRDRAWSIGLPGLPKLVVLAVE